MNVAGIEPREVVAPRSVEDLAAAARELYAADRAFAFVGGGTDLALGNAPRALDTVVRTTGCTRVVDYAPEDQTITVEAGMTVADVQDILGKNRQFLAVEVGDPERATIGGAIATNAYGKRRLRFGSIKDNIVGIRIVRPDGTAARGGGKVVKNVAGFDLPKLMVGALGTLGAIVEATFRVHPVDEHAASLAFHDLGAADVMRLCDAIIAEALVPSSIAAYADGSRYACVVAYEGFARGVDEQLRSTTAIAQRLSLRAAELTPGELSGYERREREARRSPWSVLIGAAPTALAGALDDEPAFAPYRRVWYPMLGAALIGADALEPQTIAGWRRQFADGSVTLRALPAQARGGIDAWGDPPAAFPIMQRLKANFDPKGLCNPGRFIGGL